MSQREGMSGPQFRATRVEHEAVRTTIVGGRPPGSGQSVGNIPRGLEVLMRKASVDPEFRVLLLKNAIAAADAIGLELQGAEAAMLGVIPREQLEAIIARTHVPEEHRRAFLGQAAAAMLAAMGMVTTVLATPPPMAPGGARPPSPDERKALPKPPTPHERALRVIAAQLKGDAAKIKPGDALAADLGAKPADLKKIREELDKEFRIKLAEAQFRKLSTVKQVLDAVDKALTAQVSQPAAISRGVRPDRPALPPRPN